MLILIDPYLDFLIYRNSRTFETSFIENSLLLYWQLVGSYMGIQFRRKKGKKVLNEK